MKYFWASFFLITMTFSANALPTGAENWQAECDNGKAVSCFFHGLRLLNGDEIEQNSVLAIDFARRACNMGQADACFVAGKVLYYGERGMPVMKEQSFDYFDLACQNNLHSKNACYYASRTYTDKGGDGVTALKFAEKGCQNDDSLSCGILTSSFFYGKNEQQIDIAKALPYAIKGCDLNDGRACYISGYILSSEDTSVENDMPRAMQYMDRGCELKFMQSCATVGWIHANNNRYQTAVNYLSLACNENYDNSCYSAAHLNFLLDKYEEAMPFLSKACEEENNPEACRMAGSSVVSLEGPSASRPWYQKGCEVGDQESCRYIKDLDRYESKQAEYDRIYAAQMAEREAGSARVTAALNAGNYASAMDIATYGIGSRADVSRVVLAADSAGALSQIDPFYFTFLETWLSVDYQQANAIVRREYLKNPDGVKASSVSSRGAAVASTPREPSLSDQFFQNQKDTYRRQLDWANRGGKPAGFSIERN